MLRRRIKFGNMARIREPMTAKILEFTGQKFAIPWPTALVSLTPAITFIALSCFGQDSCFPFSFGLAAALMVIAIGKPPPLARARSLPCRSLRDRFPVVHKGLAERQHGKLARRACVVFRENPSGSPSRSDHLRSSDQQILQEADRAKALARPLPRRARLPWEQVLPGNETDGQGRVCAGKVHLGLRKN